MAAPLSHEAYWSSIEVKFGSGRLRPAVYFIQGRRTKLVKIGFSNNVFQRMEGLQTFSPDILEFRCILSGGKDLEGYLHEHFAAYRQHGEWFKCSAEVRRFTGSVQSLGETEALERVGWSW